jgi:ABC-2 type transport system permease protein
MSMPTASAGDLTLSRWPDLRALAALMALAIRQFLRGRRLLVLALLFSIPSVVALVLSLLGRHAPLEAMEFFLVLNLIPHALAPLASLLYAAGLIRDEVEEQTLTYLLMRPLPRWAIFFVKWLAAYLVTSLLTALFTCLTFAVMVATATETLPDDFRQRALITAGALALAQVGYCAIFGAIGLFTKRALLWGVGYIIFFEGLLATLDTVARRLTVMYYFRVLIMRWLAPESGLNWAIDMETAPSTQTCVWILCIVGLVLTTLSAALFARSEFRVKTPEGN